MWPKPCRRDTQARTLRIVACLPITLNSWKIRSPQFFTKGRRPRSGDEEFARIARLEAQNFDVDLKAERYPTTLASFVGYNTYIESFTLNEETIEVNGNKLQGYWGLEILGNTLQGQTPEGATTVPNPFWDSAPIPQGSCIVTGAFDKPLTFSEDMDDDVVLNVHITTNQSFEWIDVIPDGVWEPSAEENVVDMGTRGIRAEIEE